MVYIFYILGSFGVGFWIAEVFLPEIRKKNKQRYFIKKFNYLFIIIIIIIGILYILNRVFGISIIIYFGSLGLSMLCSIYLVIRAINLLHKATGINADLTALIVAFLALSGLFYFSGKNYIFKGGALKPNMKWVSFTKNNYASWQFVGKYYESDKIILSGSEPIRNSIEIAIFQSNLFKKKLASQIIKPNKIINYAHSFFTGGYLAVRFSDISAGSDYLGMRVVISHKFNWRKLLLRNHPELRLLIVFLVVLQLVIILRPKLFRPTTDFEAIDEAEFASLNSEGSAVAMGNIEMPDIITEENLFQVLEKIYKIPGDQTSVLKKFVNEFSKRQNIKQDTKTLISATARMGQMVGFAEQTKRMRELLLEDSMISKHIDRLGLEDEYEKAVLERKIAEERAAAAKAKRGLGEQKEDSWKAEVENLDKENQALIKKMELARDRELRAQEIFDQIKKERPNDADQICEALRKKWYEDGLFE
jgi:hypothetical protein